jgi:hypothetical protein
MIVAGMQLHEMGGGEGIARAVIVETRARRTVEPKMILECTT